MANLEIESNLKKLLRGKKACTPGTFLKVPFWPYGNMKPSKGKMLGQGQYGKVYRGSINDNGRRYVAYKEIDTSKNTLGSGAFEYKVAKQLKGYGVPDQYMYKKCEGMDILYLELIKAKEFDIWWKTEPSMEEIKSVMVQILYNLYRIKQKFPGFRHHDLHGGNILIRSVPTKNITIQVEGNKMYKIPNGGVEAVMIDFGLSAFPRISNPTISSGAYEYVGISKNSHPQYDLHTFLNTIWNKVTQPRNGDERKIHEFIKSLIPKKYLGLDIKTKIVNGKREKYAIIRRLGLDVDKVVIPNFKTVLNNTFFTGEKKESKLNKVLKNITSKTKLQKPTIIGVPNKKSPVNQKAALSRAVTIMKAKQKPIIRRK